MSLRPVVNSDIDIISLWPNFPAICDHLSRRCAIGSGEAGQGGFLLDHQGARRFIYVDAAHTACGIICFYEMDPLQGYSSMAAYTETDGVPGTRIRMVLEALGAAFGDLGLRKIGVEVLADDHRELALYEKIGFAREGLFREHSFIAGRYADVVRLGMLSRDWPTIRTALATRVAHLDMLAARKIIEHPRRTIVVLSDAGSWINPTVADLVADWSELGYTVRWAHDMNKISSADFCFCLGFGRIIPSAIRSSFLHTLVVHESDLPRGKGWSPLTWQVLEGATKVAVTLIEAEDQVDSGAVYAQRWIHFSGNELIDELRSAQAEATVDLCRWFVDEYPDSALQARRQSGHETFYPRRTPSDSMVNPNMTIVEQFNLFRVTDNQRYPAFFDLNGRRFRIELYVQDCMAPRRCGASMHQREKVSPCSSLGGSGLTGERKEQPR